MLPDAPGIARVMRVKPNEPQPPVGYSWDDYEDAGGDVTGGTAGTTGDDEDDDGWGVVKSKSSRSRTAGFGEGSASQVCFVSYSLLLSSRLKLDSPCHFNSIQHSPRPASPATL